MATEVNQTITNNYRNHSLFTQEIHVYVQNSMIYVNSTVVCTHTGYGIPLRD